MQFILDEERPEFTWPVKVKVPVDGGKHQMQEFVGKFRTCPKKVVDEYLEKQTQRLRDMAAGKAQATPEDEEQGRKLEDAETEILREYFVGWSGIVDRQKQTVEYSDDQRDKMLNIPFVRRAVGEAYWAAINGGAKTKN